MTALVRTLVAALIVPIAMQAQGTAPPAEPPRVGPASGTVVVVGGGSMGPEIYRAFIEAAGGPDALIITVPNAGGADSYEQDGPSTRGWKAAGAKNVYTLFTKDPRVADTDSFTAVIARAGGIWFEGGRQFRLVDAYAGTKTEAAFNAVLARGGVVGGSSAGASILGDFLVRGAPSNNNLIMDYPGYEKGFSYLRNVGIDQHVVARERLPDLADSIVTKYPQLLGISEDEGTAWVVRGDTGTIVGRSKAFVYNGKDAPDEGKPFLTLYPGDRYDLGARHVLSRAAAASPVSDAFVDALFARYADGQRGEGDGPRGQGRPGAGGPSVWHSPAGALHARDDGPAVLARDDVAGLRGDLRADPRTARADAPSAATAGNSGLGTPHRAGADAAPALREPAGGDPRRAAQDDSDARGRRGVERR